MTTIHGKVILRAQGTHFELPREGTGKLPITSSKPALLLRNMMPLALPFTLALALSAIGVSRRQLWRDEVFSWWAIRLSFSDLAKLTEHVDVVLMPYYVFMHGWTAVFGDSVAALRFPSALAMACSATLVALLGKRMYGSETGLLAGLVFALIPSVSAYGQETRVYAFALTACLTATLLLLRALEAEGSAARWALYALGVSAIGLTHMVSLCVLSAHAVHVLWGTQPGSRAARLRLSWRFALALSLGLLPVVPFLVWGSEQAGQISWIRPPSETYPRFAKDLFRSTPVALLLLTLAPLGLWRARPYALLLITWGVFPPLFLALSFSLLHAFWPRYLLFILPAWALLAARASALFPSRYAGLRWLAIAPVLAGMLVVSVRGNFRERTPNGAYDYKTAAFEIRGRAQPGDAVTFEGPRGGTVHLRMAFRYLLRGSPSLLRDIFAQGTAEERGDFIPALCERAESCLPDDVQRLWFVTTAERSELFTNVPEERSSLLQTKFEVGHVWSVPRIRYALLTRRAP